LESVSEGEKHQEEKENKGRKIKDKERKGK